MKYGFQEFRIVNACADRVPACATFLYRGFEVSMSQIFDPPSWSKIAVFAREGEGECVFECDTPEQAIRWINTAGQRRLRKLAKMGIEPTP